VGSVLRGGEKSVDRRDQFEAMVKEHQAAVFRMLLRLTGSRDRVEDLAQEVFLRLFRGLEHFRGEAAISTYIYRIVVNVAQDEWKRRQKERAHTTSFDDPDAGWEERLAHRDPDAEHLLGRKELFAQVEAAMTALSDAERAVVVLYHQEDCTYEQIAEVLRLPLGTVRTHLHRGRQRLAAAMRERMGICGTITAATS
jgi:RNA polymerase sigma-70 factor (ECF subfamily)